MGKYILFEINRQLPEGKFLNGLLANPQVTHYSCIENNKGVIVWREEKKNDVKTLVDILQGKDVLSFRKGAFTNMVPNLRDYLCTEYPRTFRTTCGPTCGMAGGE